MDRTSEELRVIGVALELLLSHFPACDDFRGFRLRKLKLAVIASNVDRTGEAAYRVRTLPDRERFR